MAKVLRQRHGPDIFSGMCLPLARSGSPIGVLGAVRTTGWGQNLLGTSRKWNDIGTQRPKRVFGLGAATFRLLQRSMCPPHFSKVRFRPAGVHTAALKRSLMKLRRTMKPKRPRNGSTSP